MSLYNKIYEESMKCSEENLLTASFKEIEFIKRYEKFTCTYIFFKDFNQKFIEQPNRIAVLRTLIFENIVEQFLCHQLFLKSIHCPTKQIIDNYQIVKCLFYQLLVSVKIIKTISSVTQQRQVLHFLQYTQNSGHLWTRS